MIHESRLTKLIAVPFRADIAQLIPHAKRFTHKGVDMLAMRHGIDETKLLNNLGLDRVVKSPIESFYDFPAADGKRPFQKQIETATHMVMNRRSYVLNEMGTGKTRSCIWAHDFLFKEGLANKMLVVAPLSTLEFTWRREILHAFPFKIVNILTGTAERRRKLLDAEADIYIINHDGLRVMLRELEKRHDIDVICFDEVAAFRNNQAERSKMAQRLARGRKYIWGMTGSPTPNEPTDAYGLAHLITPATAPKSFVLFRQDTMFQLNGNQFKWVPKKEANTIVARVLQPSIRVSLDEIVELPDVVIQDLEVQMGPRQEKVYKQLCTTAAVWLKEGTITALNGGHLFTKALQVAGGWAYGDVTRKVISLDNGMRLKALLDVIAGAPIDLCDPASHKIIVFSPFKCTTAGIDALLKFHNIDFATVTGDTSPKARNEIFSAFQGTSKYRVLNAHPECMSHGITLTAADTIVWFGPTPKLEVYEQANARITRVGQKHRQHIIRMVGCPTERTMYRKLANKQDMQAHVLDLIQEMAKEAKR